MHLNETHIEWVIEFLNTWRNDVTGTLTWNRVASQFKKKFGDAPTDRSFRNHPRLQHRFTERKKELRGQSVTSKIRSPSSLRVAAERITELESKIEYLNKVNEMFLQRLTMYQKNAHDFGMTKKDLEKSLTVTADVIRNNKKNFE